MSSIVDRLAVMRGSMGLSPFSPSPPIGQGAGHAGPNTDTGLEGSESLPSHDSFPGQDRRKMARFATESSPGSSALAVARPKAEPFHSGCLSSAPPPRRMTTRLMASLSRSSSMPLRPPPVPADASPASPEPAAFWDGGRLFSTAPHAPGPSAHAAAALHRRPDTLPPLIAAATAKRSRAPVISIREAFAVASSLDAADAEADPEVLGSHIAKTQKQAKVENPWRRTST